MAQIIEFPLKNKRLSSETLTPVCAPERYPDLLHAYFDQEKEDDGAMGLLGLLEEAPLSPEKKRIFTQFLFHKIFDRTVALEKREGLAAAMAALFVGAEHNKILLPRLVLGEKEERMVAAIALGFSGNRAALKPLTAALSDEDSDIQKAAAFGLSGLKDGALDGEIIDTLSARLAETTFNEVRVVLLVNLKLFARPSLEPLFLAYSDSQFPEIQITALGGLLFFCSQAGLSRAAQLLKSDKEPIRATALSVLERHGSKSHLEAIFPVLGDESPRIRNLAREALERLRERAPNSVDWVS